jgi:hypothetical protein
MKRLPNMKLYKECSQCRSWAFGQYDVYCSRCGHELKDHEEWLASISDYAKSMLIEYLDSYPDLAMKADISEIPDYATEGIRANGNILFNQAATRRILAECWNEVEIALDDWKDNTGTDYPANNVERLHIFSVTQHAEMIWRNITEDMQDNNLNDETIAEAIDLLRR